MNKEQQELLDEVYENYKRFTHSKNEKDGNYGEYSKWGDNPLISGVQHLTKGTFIQMIKIDFEFSERWGLKIEERELSLEKRRKIVLEGDPHGIQSTDNWTQQQLEDCKKQLDEWNIPTKQITIAYNDKTIENYE
jgi:hypothetical protein